MTTKIDRGMAYVNALPPGISGDGGHAATFRAACAIYRLGFGDSEAMMALREFNRRCLPPWSENELLHKLRDARKSVGHSLTPPSAKPVRLTWSITRKPIIPKTSKDPALPVVATPSDLQDGDKCVLCPGERIPAQFLDTLKSWTAFREHPAWNGSKPNHELTTRTHWHSIGC